MQDDLKSLATDGVLRVAINTGNRALVQEQDGVLKGISPALAQRLAGQIDARFEPVMYTGAGPVFDDAENNLWDVAFLAIDAKRAEKIAFTRAYVTIEATYAVRADAPFQDVGSVDGDGVRVLTSYGSAYDMYLSKSLNTATLERFGTPTESFEAFRDGRCDAVAGVRASLMRFFDNDKRVRILPGVLTKVEQAMALPDRRDPRIVALDRFVGQAIDEGFVAETLASTVSE